MLCCLKIFVLMRVDERTQLGSLPVSLLTYFTPNFVSVTNYLANLIPNLI